jgi:hypothetical protein
MDKLKFLEVKRLFKKLEWVEADYTYQSELISNADIHFKKSVSDFLEIYPDLKSIYVDDVSIEKPSVDEEDELVINDKANKDLFRSIVKETHPDKVSNDMLNSFYIEANNAYEKGDYLELLRLSVTLDIIPENDIPIQDIKDRINLYETRTDFLKKTFTWKWLESDESGKKKVIVEYISKNVK